MKKAWLVFILLLVALPLAAAPFRFFGYAWLRYTDTNPFDESLRTTGFSVPRSYWRVEHRVSDALTVRGTLDISSVQLEAGKSGWSPRVKFMQADWSPKLLRWIPDFAFIFGAQPTFFGLVDLWDYPMIERSFEDIEGKVSSADIGVALRAGLPLKLGSLKVGLLNGTSFLSPLDNNNNKAIDACLTLKPLPPIWLRGSAWVATWPGHDSLGAPLELARNRYAASAGLNAGPVWLMGEYLVGEDDVVDFWGYSGFVQVSLGKRLELCGRYDHILLDKADASSAHDRVAAGFNCELAENLRLQANYQLIAFADTSLAREDKIVVQVKYSWGIPLEPAE